MTLLLKVCKRVSVKALVCVRVSVKARVCEHVCVCLCVLVSLVSVYVCMRARVCVLSSHRVSAHDTP